MTPVLLLALLQLLFPAAAAPAETVTGTVVEVRDGDTIEVDVGTGTVAVRLHGVDCPGVVTALRTTGCSIHLQAHARQAGYRRGDRPRPLREARRNRTAPRRGIAQRGACRGGACLVVSALRTGRRRPASGGAAGTGRSAGPVEPRRAGAAVGVAARPLLRLDLGRETA